MKNMLAMRREELEEEVNKRATELEEYILENAPSGRINLGHLDEGHMDVEYWMRKSDNKIDYWTYIKNKRMDEILSSFDLVKYGVKIKKQIDETNEGMINEMRGVLDGN